MTEQAPLRRGREFNAPAVAAASSANSPAGEVPFAGAVSGVTYTPQAAITGVNTNTRQIRLVNRGQDGSGSTVVASLQFDSGVNAPAYDERALNLSGVAGALNVNAGDILAWESNAVGTGLADPGGLAQIEFNRA